LQKISNILEALAEELKVSRSRIGSYEENRSSPTLEFLISFSNYFKVPIDILLRNGLTKAKNISFIEIGGQRVLFPISVDEDDNNLIEIISAKALAGHLSGYDDPEYIEQLQKNQASVFTYRKA